MIINDFSAMLFVKDKLLDGDDFNHIEEISLDYGREKVTIIINMKNGLVKTKPFRQKEIAYKMFAKLSELILKENNVANK